MAKKLSEVETLNNLGRRLTKYGDTFVCVFCKEHLEWKDVHRCSLCWDKEYQKHRYEKISLSGKGGCLADDDYDYICDKCM